ncbi:MAG: hypothetical protein LLG04_18570 [Parachlamydia sp.]|nr:hypothetical protein [Parachlamydia sp.]
MPFYIKLLSHNNDHIWPAAAGSQLMELVQQRRQGKISKIARGSFEGEQRGIPAYTMNDKYWREAYLDSHNANRDKECSVLFKQWVQHPTQATFEDWVSEQKGPTWLSDHEVVRDGKPVACRMPYFDNPAPYEVRFSQGALSTQNTLGRSPAGTYKYVVSPEGKLYMGTKTNVGLHHSSFLSGGAVVAAGVLKLDDQGRVIALNNSSGHYGPPAAALLRMIRLLTKQGVDLSHLSEIAVVGKEDVILHRFHSVTQFLSSVKSLSGSSKVELLTLLKTMQDLGIRIDNIQIIEMDRAMPLDHFLANMTALDASCDDQDVDDMVQFLQEQDFDFSQLHAIDTVPGLSCMSLVTQIPIDLDQIDFRIRDNLKPLEIALEI